ncbi:MAG: T9SS type A sorting domain-containing protein [bacterium]|nr:T9SS type A sorting domain-containing protein [bacterium]
MMTLCRLFIAGFLFVLTLNAGAAENKQVPSRDGGVWHGGNAEFSKSSRDTIILIGPWGSGAQVNGQFQNSSGAPDWNGWTHWDVTQSTENHFHLSDYNSPHGVGNMAMYCGDESIPACNEDDVEGGYGNSWSDILRISYMVEDPAEGCEITVSGLLNHDSEPGYDYINFFFQTADGGLNVGSLDGEGTQVTFSHTMDYDVADYAGENSDEVRFDIHFRGAGAYSDVDCLFSGSGACTVDDLHVVCSNGNYDYTEDFSNGMGDWELAYPLGTGDFAQIWTGLEDIDPCRTNYSPQVAFIDDGTQVPGVGPSYCQDWCYGPGGYIVNTTGGAAIVHDPNAQLHNVIESPVVVWPGENNSGAEFSFDVYRHEDLSPDSPRMFFSWSVRSGSSEEEILAAEWENRDLLFYGGPDYIRSGDIVSDLLISGLTHIQVQLTCVQVLQWHWSFDDGTPAPYFDNVRLTAFPLQGPSMTAREIDLANDNWPASGELDLTNLAANNIRFDAAINNGDNTLNTPGDSIVCNVVSCRAGGQLVENRLYYSMDRNPVFDSVRNPAWHATGFVDGQPAVGPQGNPVDGKFAYDLPDSGFLFPGDVLHYYFSATDEVGSSAPETSTLPASTVGFGDFTSPTAYNTSFQVHALPSVDVNGNRPDILFWFDSTPDNGQDEWFSALRNLELVMGQDYDLYQTNGADSGVGNGLGGRATIQLLEGYEILLYTSGDLANFTISNGDPGYDPGDDAGLLAQWLDQGDVDFFATGDGLVSDLHNQGNSAADLMTTHLNVIWVDNNLRPRIANQSTPLVRVELGNDVFSSDLTWVAYGGCDVINKFDAVEAGPGAQRLARFADPSGEASYDYSAATLNETNGNKVITMPYDFMSIYTDPSNPIPGGLATRVKVLEDVLRAFGRDPCIGCPSDVPESGVFSVNNYPNPFNPSTKIQFNLPKAGPLSLKIYNLRGEWVKTLIDEHREAGSGQVLWDGSNGKGAQVSSGIYFYEVRTAGEVIVNKMALVK